MGKGGGKLSQRCRAVPSGKGGGTLYERAGHACIVICTTTYSVKVVLYNKDEGNPSYRESARGGGGGGGGAFYASVLNAWKQK